MTSSALVADRLSSNDLGMVKSPDGRQDHVTDAYDYSGSAIFRICLPMFLPVKSRFRVSGMFSKPC
jgi:hypothetical protein